MQIIEMQIIGMIMVALLTLLEIDWNRATNGVMMVLAEAEIASEHLVTFVDLRQMDNGAILATVDSPTLEGDNLWLSGKFGPQNGLLSLTKAADGGENIEGNTFLFSRIESEQSPSGYAYRWQTHE